jgi:hypothetical protein
LSCKQCHDEVVEALVKIAEMATDGRLDEAQCFLRARALAQTTCKELEVDFVDSTFRGKEN